MFKETSCVVGKIMLPLSEEGLLKDVYKVDKSRRFWSFFSFHLCGVLNRYSSSHPVVCKVTRNDLKQG